MQKKPSGYKTNEEKSVIMGLNIPHEVKAQLSSKNKAIWKENGIRYLGICISDELKKLFTDNLTPLTNMVPDQLANWEMLKLSWYVHIASVKMKLLPKFLFIFQSLIWTVPQNEYIYLEQNKKLELKLQN